MNLEEKKRANEYFIKNKLTYGTYAVLMIFHENITRMTNLIELHIIFLKRIDSGDVKHTFPESELLRLKHLVMMDVLSKIMIMIESLMSLLDCFSRFSHGDIPAKMVRYDLRRINGFIERLQKGEVSLWRMAGFPGIDRLRNNCGLTKDEAKLIDKILHDSCKSIQATLKDIVDFYSANRILFGKFKHGLLFLAGCLFSYKEDYETPKSYYLTFDRLKERPVNLCFEGKEISPPGLEWFNTYSILPYWNRTFELYNDIINGIRRLSEHVIYNHLLWAFNCGEDYLPLKRLSNDEAVVEVYLTKELAEEENQRFQEIAQKVTKNVLVPKLRLEAIFNFGKEKVEKLVKCFLRNQSATIWKTND